ncbi:uncharacterized protein LOC118193845 [Stegodyphus dumicola]|uniref:uncharacterized protein LOC118193845 n=1 Tax=Stegodyphus dumicola TaxID=202533 RepID=UPI0015A7E537|nr:uncharacterized protein LOC118193845 [Stegodyphus dumicola]
MSSEETVERNRKIRGSVRTSVTKLIRKLDEELQSENPNLEVLQESLSVLIERETSLLKYDEVINAQSTVQELETEVEHCLEYSESIIRCKSKVNRYIQNVGKTGTTSQVSEIKTNYNTKLPRITLETFSGDLCKFTEFWAQYKAAIHENNTLQDVEKFNYLRSLLTGSAAKAISGLPLIGENYIKAIEILTDRFGKKEILVSAHMNVLLAWSQYADQVMYPV